MTAEGFEQNKANVDRRLNKINLLNEDNTLIGADKIRKPLEVYPHFIEIMSWWLPGEKEKLDVMMEKMEQNASYNAAD